MPWNGSGNFSLLYNWPNERDAGLPNVIIDADKVQAEFENVEAGLEAALARNGENTPTANLPMAGFVHTGVGAASARTNYAQAAQIQDGGLTWGGSPGGTVDAMTAILAPAVTAYTAGLRVQLIVPGTGSNTVTAPTIALNGLATKTIERAQAVLSVGDYAAGDVIDLQYDGSAFQILTPSRVVSVAAGSITSAMIVNGTIATDDLADGAVTSAKIANGTIATDDLADGAVTSAKIANGTIVTDDLADDAVTAAKIAAGTITSAEVDSSIMLTGKHMLPILAAAMTSRTTNGAASGTTESTTNKVMLKTLDFDQSTTEYAQIMVPMAKSWNESTVTARFRWTAASGSGDVIWAIRAVALSNDDPIDSAFGTAQTVTDTLLAANDKHTTSETSAVTIAGTPAEGDLVVFEVYRDAANGSDNLSADAKLIAVDLFITYNAGNDA